jgi:transposase
MASLPTRTYIHVGHDFYLTPLPEKQLPSDWLCQYLGPVHSGQVQTETIKRGRADGQLVEIAIGYERLVQIESEFDGLAHRWQERRLVVRSFSAAKTAEDGLYKRLAQAEQELYSLNERGRGKKRPDNRGAVEAAVTAVLQHYRVGELLLVECEEQVSERVVRSYKGQPARVKSRWDFKVNVKRDEEALQRTVAGLGWRVYATNQAASELSLEGAVLAYREEYLIEASFGRLKGVPLSLRPFYLQRDDHAKGLVRLLGLGLRVLSLLEFVVRRQLAGGGGSAGGGSLAGLYKGQPQAATARPSAERLLESFSDLTLSRVELAGQVLYHLTPLSKLQLRILELLGFPPGIYTKLTGDSSQPP